MKKSAILLLLLFAALAAGAQPFYRKPVAPVRNVIVMIPDGTSTSVLAAARWYKFYNDPSQRMLNLDSCLCGLVGTFSSDSPIPCSAPAMSAYMTGMPQQAGNVSVYPAANPAQDIVEVESGRACQPLATLPTPGGPVRNMWWRPAAATSSAQRASSCPATSVSGSVNTVTSSPEKSPNRRETSW